MSAPVITPAGPLALHGKVLQHFAADQSVTWTKTGGTFSGTTSTAVDWTAPNVSGSYTLRATNGSSQFTEVTIVVIGVVPQGPSWDFKISNKKKVLLFESDDGSRQTRTKRGKKRTFEVTTNLRQRANWAELVAFWDAHYPGKQVYINNPGANEEMLGWLNSDLDEQWHLTNLVSWAFVFQEA